MKNLEKYTMLEKYKIVEQKMLHIDVICYFTSLNILNLKYKSNNFHILSVFVKKSTFSKEMI